MTLHLDALPAATQRAFEFFSNAKWLADDTWYLAGGTALTLQVGHRSSEDLDFFTQHKEFSQTSVLNHLSEPDWVTNDMWEGTIYGAYKHAKVSFIAYPFFVPKAEKIAHGALSMLSMRDIAVMKIIATSQRGRKRDFLDLYWYAKNAEPLLDIILRLPEQYPTVAHDYQHILKSMLYFSDADNDPMPTLFFKADWDEIKSFFRREIPPIAKRLMGLEENNI